jgi:hypothetical protein
MKKLTIEDGVAILIDVIAKKKRHRDYDRVTKMADNLTRLITGEDMDVLMRQFDRRESTGQFAQRKRITQHITSTVCRNLMKPAYKIPRSNGVRRVLNYKDDSENKKLKDFEAILEKFWGNKSFDDYLSKRWIDLTHSDPNSFIVFEWDEFDGRSENALPYPFEVSSHEAIYYIYENNILQFLVVENDFEPGVAGIQERTTGNNNSVKRYTVYFPGFSIVFDQLSREEEERLKPNQAKEKYSEGLEYIDINRKIFKIGIYKSRLDFVPAVRVGFEYDISTRARTCLSAIDEVVPILMKMVKANSELDLSMALHAHPQRIQYLPECEHCNKGLLPDGNKCRVCNGTGVKRAPTTGQESIELKMPRDKEDIVTLENIVKYIYPPVDLIKFQDEYIKSLTAQCKEAKYNSELFSRQEIAETATGKNIDLQNVYDALYSMAKAFEFTWEFGIKTIAKITDKYLDLIYNYTFSKDFKMKSLNDLYWDLKIVSDSKADAFVKQGIQDDIARMIYTDDPTGYLKYKTKEEFYPYSGKTQEQIALIVGSAPPDDFNRTLWESYGWIFGELEREYLKKGINFYELARSKQWSALKRKVEALAKNREGVKPFEYEG